MATDAVANFADVLARYRLLEPNQLDELSRSLLKRFTEPHGLFKELVQREWLTPYQANQLLLGKGPELVLGSYVLISRLSETVMGVLFKARHQAMRRMVALQVVRADLLQKPEAVAKFYEEIQTASQLSNPHIVAAYDAGPIGSTHFFAMEYVEGTDLDRLVHENGPLPVEQACDYTNQAAEGLQHAFERGLLHHDLKPSNLLIVARGQGPARVKQTLPGKRRTAIGAGALLKINNMGLTIIRQHKRRTKIHGSSSGELTIGTPDFLAPELTQEGRKPDVRSELYSLGCCLYYQLAGCVPFPGGSVADKLRRHQLEEPAPLDKLRGGVPPEATALLRKLLAKRPEDRYQTPGEVSRALAPLLHADNPSTDDLPALPAEAATIFSERSQPEGPINPRSSWSLGTAKAEPPHNGRRPRAKRGMLINLAWIGLLLGSLAVFLYLLVDQGVLSLSSGSGEGSSDTSKIEPTEPRPRQRLGKRFDGLSDHIDVPHHASLDPPELTVETWVRLAEVPTGEDPRRWLVNKNTHEHTQGYYGLLIHGQKLGAYLNIGGGDKNVFDIWSMADVLTLDDWHHAAMTYDGAVLRLYGDGVELAHKEVKRPRVAGTTSLTIGRRQDGVQVSYFKGFLDDIRIYNRALSPEEIKAQQDQSAAFTPKAEKGLAKYWRY
jgi:serine/threonine-protein kinase